jgi:WD repeat-containing protein 1 (actin-interacting protein 1)
MAAQSQVKPQKLFASLPGTTRGQPTVLKGDPKGKNFVYCCGNSVIMRDIANPDIADQYCEHQTSPTVAAYAPSGYYMASGDSSGTMRIWDTVGEDRICKLELR